jgi:hypothetical protein
MYLGIMTIRDNLQMGVVKRERERERVGGTWEGEI